MTGRSITKAGCRCIAVFVLAAAFAGCAATGNGAVTTLTQQGAARTIVIGKSTKADIEAAFGRATGTTEVELTNRSTSIKTLEWERIHETLAETGFNISETARRLGMHRRTLARKLGKQQVK